MMHKKLLTLALALTFVSSLTQALTVTYPSKNALKKADHIVSLAITTMVGAAVIADRYNYGGWKVRLLGTSLVLAGTNSIINGMALKHERSVAALLKLLLPVSFLGGFGLLELADHYRDRVLHNAAAVVFMGGLAGNAIKNIWDVYSLIKYNQTESTQHDA
jgi:hypothetical protein